MSRAARNIAWIEQYLIVPEGPTFGQPVRLPEFVKEDIRKIYDNPAGTRRAILSRGRKNIKTAEAAMLMLLHLCGPEARPNSGLFSSAQSKEQAAVLFWMAAKMVRLSPTLNQYVGVREHIKELYCRDLGTVYKALSAEAKTKFGLSPVFIVHDELGQVKGPRSSLYSALETATGAQQNPLSIIISTQAPTDADLLSVLIDDALTGADPRVVISLHTCPVEADPFDVANIRLANPGFDTIQNQQEILAMAADARRMPATEAEYRNLVLNQRVEVKAPFISRAVWEEGKHPVVPPGKAEVFLGFDLSEVRDLTCRVAVYFADGRWQVQPTFWLPADGLRERARGDRVPYDLWAEQGHIQLVPGKTVSYMHVAQDTAAFIKGCKFGHAGFDRYNWRHFKPWLVKAGVQEATLDKRFHDYGMGIVSMSPALRTLEEDILAGLVAHGGHPVLTMCMANAVVARDTAGNRRLDKAASRGRIDGAVALAIARAMAAQFTKQGNAGIKLL